MAIPPVVARPIAAAPEPTPAARRESLRSRALLKTLAESSVAPPKLSA
jgi:hypothetical protein